MSTAFVVAMMFQAAASAAEPPPPRLPKDFDVRTHWPTSAHRARIEGRAVVECQVRSDGVAHGCKTVSEVPLGMGFGVATVRAFEGQKLEPGTSGAGFPPTVKLPLNFTLRNDGPYIRVVAHDGWAVIQQYERWREFYPGRARANGVEGEVDVTCGRRTDGGVGCEVTREEPKGHGFGEAALEVQRRLAISPPPGGAKSSGGKVRTTIIFNPR